MANRIVHGSGARTPQESESLGGVALVPEDTAGEGKKSRSPKRNHQPIENGSQPLTIEQALAIVVEQTPEDLREEARLFASMLMRDPEEVRACRAQASAERAQAAEASRVKQAEREARERRSAAIEAAIKQEMDCFGAAGLVQMNSWRDTTDASSAYSDQAVVLVNRKAHPSVIGSVALDRVKRLVSYVGLMEDRPDLVDEDALAVLVGMATDVRTLLESLLMNEALMGAELPSFVSEGGAA